MKLNLELSRTWILGGLIFGLGLMALPPKLHANVYATNLRLNGDTTNIVASPGTNISISFLLNEPASLGTTIQIRSGASTVTSLFFPPESEGTLRGFNEVEWNGLNTNNQPIPGGTYSIAVVPASSGYTNWTQITSDTSDPNTYVFDGRGIAVDRNPDSFYYGRIFVANSSIGPNPTSAAGDALGILRLNADTTSAEEFASSAGLDGYDWLGGAVSPWKLEVASDDNVYVTDLARGGLVNRWDPTISSNSMVAVLRQDNVPTGAALSGPAFGGSTTNMQLLMADTNMARVIKWSLTTNSVCSTNDTGTIVVSNTGPNFFDVAVDKNGNIYTCAFIDTSGDPSPRVFRYPPYNPAVNGGLPQTNADWAVGGGDDTYAGASGLAVDPSGTYVAVAFQGTAGGFSTNGNTRVLYATNGAVAANIDLGLKIQNDPSHADLDVAWDAVGNIYNYDYYWLAWRAFSPPGTNQSTSIAAGLVQLSGSTPPPPSSSLQIGRITISGGNVNIDFTADTNSTVSQFTVQGAPTLTGTYTAIPGAQITQLGPGSFHATFPLAPGTQYFRLLQQGGTPPPPSQPNITKLVVSGSNIVLTFSGNPSDTPSAYTVFASPSATGTYVNANATVSLLSPGVFQASVPMSGPTQFYRIRK